MASRDIKVTISDAELRKALSDPELVAGPVRDFLLKSALTVEARAKETAPVDTGRFRASIKHQVEHTQAIVGSNVEYAPFIEFGSRPHWPPRGALQPWARRHGFPPGLEGDFLVRQTIARRGTRARHVFQRALDHSRGTINGFIEEMKLAIRQRWERRRR